MTSLPVLPSNQTSEHSDQNSEHSDQTAEHGNEGGAQPRKAHLLNLPDDALKDWLSERGYPAFRAKQIRRWLYSGRAESFDSMSDLPAKLRAELAESFDIFQASEAHVSTSRDGTEKILVRLADGGEVECVLLRDGDRRSICVSSQVGCAMGCVFCASGLDGVDRNLTRGEILEQMLRLQHRLPADERLSHIVMMGMGEPLANLPGVLAALDVARNPDGLGISPRRITISTVGLPPAIDKLAASKIPYNLAVSLHAPNDELRSRLVPVNQKIGIEPVLSAADRYFQSSGRRLTFEYVLLGGINDSESCAHELTRVLRGRTVMMNVIPYNPVEGLPYKTPSKESISRFKQILESSGVNVMFRQRKGDEIDAACGQLRRNRGGKTK
ncbi:23S rRNA (adenine(2503)-C(2))-methyltransferase RlmN [Rhodopirellula sallentina]|uniref:Probable dual-specificity RNA methyltransferase RlmN n=1 Tax=Rhodopirellula sallentina SM41 TaxID=1263870 RepID=M5TW84_9BACT|nr:23S rRNA (adenine(2503)-C(2))-methyltransferase RlmN [Rhodopirellula sallentina]EMI53472.1 ribosomal RNA large subunit methyltransferase N [Rhodopirellula sallentina SM41]